jgi:hypothetical protein
MMLALAVVVGVAANNVALLNSQRRGYPKAVGSTGHYMDYVPSNMFQGKF